MEDLGSAFRVLDTNLNRAGEGLRTLEDIARLIRQDGASALHLKNLRHALGTAAASLSREDRLAARCLLTDAGAEISHAAELNRNSISTIVSAASERVLQSLRTCEEFAKLIDAQAAEHFKSLRYTAYDVLAQVELNLTRHAWLQSTQLCILLDCQKPLQDFVQYLSLLADAGANCIQLREKKLDDSVLLNYAEVAKKKLDEFGAKLIINDRLDIALAVEAAGVHVGQEDLPLAAARRVAGHKLCIGVSTHSIQQAQIAQDGGADYIGCGPTFPSQTKQFATYAGVPLLQSVSSKIQLPTFAIGGIHENNLSRVLASGAKRIAVSAAVHASPDPQASVRSLVTQLAAVA